VPNPYRLTAYDKMLMQKRSDRELAADDPEWVELQQRRQGAWDFPGGGTPTPLSTYDRGLVQAVTDGELGRDDPDYMDVVQGMQLSPSRSLIDVPVPPDTTSAVLSAGPDKTGLDRRRPAIEAGRAPWGGPSEPGELVHAIQELGVRPGGLGNGNAGAMWHWLNKPANEGVEEAKQKAIELLPEGTTQDVGTIAGMFVPDTNMDVLLGALGAPGIAAGAGIKSTKLAAGGIPKALRVIEDMLPLKNWNFFRRGVENTDNAKGPLSFLLPAEVEPLTRSSGAVRKFVDTYERLPDVDYLASAIRRGSPKRGWYVNSRQALTGIFGDDADMFTGLLAATSPQTSVESNLQNALNIFVNWRAAGRPRAAAEIKAIMGRSVQGSGTQGSVLEAWENNTVRVLQGGQSISGPKIDQFWLALRDRALQTRTGSMDPDQAMVLDAWMANLMGADQKLWSGSLSDANTATRLAAGDAGATPSYLAGVARMREAANKVGVKGAEAQEMAWSTAMALYERSSSLSMSAREVLQRGLLTDEVVAGTPDFATLLRAPELASILGRDSDLAARLSSFTPTPAVRQGADSVGATVNRDLMRVADTLDDLRSMRVTDTAVQTPKVPMGELPAVMATEAVTDKQWSSLGAPFSTTTPGQRAYLSPRVFGASESLREQSSVLDAALGGGTGSRSRGVGSWVDDVGQPQIDDLRERIDTLGHGDERQDLERLLAQLEADQVQENPLASYGARVQEVRGGGISVEEERRLRAARDIIAGGTGQSAAAHVAINPRMPRAQHDAATIYAGSDVPANAAKAFAADLRALDVPGSFTQVHSGRSVRVLRLDDGFNPLAMSPADEASVRELAGRHLGTKNAKGQQVAPSITTGQNVAVKGFVQIAQGADASSGERVRRMVGDVSDWAKLSPAVQRRMDTAIKAWATRLQGTLDMALIRGERPDEARMLEILASSGGSGLAKAREAGVVLPALAALGFGLAPSGPSGALTQGEES